MDDKQIFDSHEAHTGVLDVQGELPINNPKDLSRAYTPGVAEIAKQIEAHPEDKQKYTISGKLVGVISDGTAVLGLGNVGPAASLPIVEGKSLIYKEFADVDALPLALEQVPTDELAKTIENMAVSFAGIHLEDIQAPRCFEVEERLKEVLDIPVYHDDQEGTAIVVLAALINAATVVQKELKDLHVIVNGVGASGYATAKLLRDYGIQHITLVDKAGVIQPTDEVHFNRYQRDLALTVTQAEGETLADILPRQDVFIGLSDANVLTSADVAKMAPSAIVFSLANPVPEITPEDAQAGGAAVTATGSSQWANQVNNILAFPGLFKGLLQTNLKQVDANLQIQVAEALAGLIVTPKADEIIPGVFDDRVVETVSQAVQAYATETEAQ